MSLAAIRARGSRFSRPTRSQQTGQTQAQAAPQEASAEARIIVLAGGVGAGRFLQGLVQVVPRGRGQQ